MPHIVACGSRRDAYDSFCTAIDKGKDALLLVDSEAPVAAIFQNTDDDSTWQPWGHLSQSVGGQWSKPKSQRFTMSLDGAVHGKLVSGR